MKITSVEKKEKSTVELVIEVGAEEFEAAVQKAYLKNRNSISVPGFRKGKVPRKIIENMYGTEVFYNDAIEAVYPDAYAQAIEEQKLDVVGYPEMDIVTVGKEGFTFKALVPVRPEVKLGDYKGLTAVKEEVKITEKDINGELEPFIKRATRLSAVKRKAKKGDTAVIDFEGFDNGTAFEGGKGENYSLELGSGAFVPGFEEQVIGMKAGEEKDIDITFPEDYHADLAGKPVVFHVKVNEVKEPVKPELDDEFAKDVSEFETLEELKKDLADKLETKRSEDTQRAFENSIMEQLISGMEAEIPQGMINARADKLIDDMSMRLANQGIKLEQYLSMVGITMEQLRADSMPRATQQIQTELALGAVAEAEKLEVSDEEIDAEINRLAEEYKMEVEQVKMAVAASDLRNDMLLNKASKFVFDNAKVGKAKKAAAKKTTKKSTKKDSEVAEEAAEEKKEEE